MISKEEITFKGKTRQLGSWLEIKVTKPKLKIVEKFDRATKKSKNCRNCWSSNGDGECVRSGNMVWSIITNKDIETICKHTCNYIFWVQTRSSDNVMIDKRINIVRDMINIFHHCSWAVDDEKFIPQQLLSPPSQLMNIAIVFQNLLNNIEIKYTVKQCPPKLFA